MRCAYLYSDGGQCVTKAPEGKKVCHAHTLLMQMAKDKKAYAAKRYQKTKESRPSRAKPKLEVVVKEPKYVYYDHTAPWKCNLITDCDICKNKPTYIDWVRKRGQ